MTYSCLLAWRGHETRKTRWRHEAKEGVLVRKVSPSRKFSDTGGLKHARVEMQNQTAIALCDLEKLRLQARTANVTQRLLPLDGIESNAAQQRLQHRQRALSRKRNFLTMCMSTVPRGKGSIGYLPFIIEALLAQMRDVPTKLKLVLMNALPGQHKTFEDTERKYADASEISFVDMPPAGQAWADPSSFEPDNMNNPSFKPGGEVRRQTYDIQQLLNECARPHNRGDFTLLLEDDFLPCPFALLEIVRALEVLPACRPTKDWKTVSFSKGTNGIAMPTVRSLNRLTSYLGEMREVRPPDLLVYDSEWGNSESLSIAYRYHSTDKYMSRQCIFMHTFNTDAHS